MKKILFVIFALAYSFASQAQASISLKESVINWKGSQAFQMNTHHGTVHFKKGGLLYEDRRISGGSFVIDMNSIANTDGKFNEMLVDHLKNEDFFDVQQFPTATLIITDVKHDLFGFRIDITADLTIKGITHSITFAAQEIKKDDKSMPELKANFSIDRAKWNIKYGSASFFKNLGDDTISDTIDFEVTIKPNGC